MRFKKRAYNLTMNRRDLLKAAALLPWLSFPDVTHARPSQRRRLTRIAYLGDTHLMPRRKPMKGLAQCLHHIQNQTDKPSLILNGGDSIMDSVSRNRRDTRRQWEAWQTVLRAECSLPVEHCLGNHDVWAHEESVNDPLAGKNWAQEQLLFSHRYRSFDRDGWHFIILDSIQPKKTGGWYSTHLDDEQLDWLRADLKKTGTQTPILVLSHVPIISGRIGNELSGTAPSQWVIPDGAMHTDAPTLVGLFGQYPNLKTCLSGHRHVLDDVQYAGVNHLCNGAVSGNWWQSKTFRGTRRGYALLDLYDDGTAERTYVTY